MFQKFLDAIARVLLLVVCWLFRIFINFLKVIFCSDTNTFIFFYKNLFTSSSRNCFILCRNDFMVSYRNGFIFSYRTSLTFSVWTRVLYFQNEKRAISSSDSKVELCLLKKGNSLKLQVIAFTFTLLQRVNRWRYWDLPVLFS